MTTGRRAFADMVAMLRAGLLAPFEPSFLHRRAGEKLAAQITPRQQVIRKGRGR